MTTPFETLETICQRPVPFGHYSSPHLWNDPHISKGMLEAHLDQDHDVGSYPEASIDRAISWIAARPGVGEATRVCDLGCGPGLWTTRFARRGAEVTGVDFSIRSLKHAEQIARDEALEIRYVNHDYLELSLEEHFDLITMVHGDFSVLSPVQRRVLLSKIRTLLLPDGQAMIEAFSMAHYRSFTEGVRYDVVRTAGYWSPKPHHVFLHTFKFEAESLICQKYTVIDEDREFDIFVWTQCYTVEALKEVFEQAGLCIEELYADMAGSDLQASSPRMMAVASVM